MHHEWRRDPYLISTARQRLDLAVIHGFLTRAYWSTGIPLATVQHAVEHSLNFGVYREDQQEQVGFARVVTDSATFAYLADVFILEAYRGQGLGVWLVETIMAHPDLQGLRRWTLATRDAHTLYQKVGFTPLKQPERWLEKVDFAIYTRNT